MAETVRERITIEEFLKLPETNTPTELIHGVLIVSPAPIHVHQRIIGKLFLYLSQVTGKTTMGGEVVVSPSDVHLDEENVVQPDVFWVSGSESRCQLGDDGYWHGAPDLVIEVLSPSTARRDRIEKFKLYEAHGVREYWLVDPEAQLVEVFEAEDDRFQNRRAFGPDDTFESALLGGEHVKLADIFE